MEPNKEYPWGAGKKPDEIIQDWEKKFKSNLPKGSAWKYFIPLLLILFLLKGVVYTVEPYEEAVIRRFGKFVRKAGPGLHFKLPLLFGLGEEVNKVNIEKKFREEFGYRTIEAGVTPRYSNRDYSDERLILTADLNVMAVQWSVQYRIKDSVNYLFKVRNYKKTLRDISESVMRDIVGDYSFDEILTKRLELNINNLVQERMQKILDYYVSGIQIVTVEFQGVVAPDAVLTAFNEENEAEQEKETLKNQAWQVYNQKIPEARGQALKMLREAEGYSAEVVNRAEGDAERFNELLKAYTRSKQVTKRRIYMEKMGNVMRTAGEVYVVDPDVKGIVPLLRLGSDEN
ncbi:MAG: FtsH protease activity modulator HflK [Candidatus Omnitrophica bacterium]|nr:FtsH protease activity modulator HflK [Candidatus Omnitrophota bacterium]